MKTDLLTLALDQPVRLARIVRAYIRFVVWLRFVDKQSPHARREALALAWTSLPLPRGWWRLRVSSIHDTQAVDDSAVF